MSLVVVNQNPEQQRDELASRDPARALPAATPLRMRAVHALCAARTHSAILAGVWLAGLALGGSPAQAGTYPMYQCGGGTTAVAPGWTAFGQNTQASTVMWNTCGAGGTLGVYAFTNGQPGAVTENGSSGSSVGLALDVPASAPDVTIQAISASVSASSVTGDDGFLEFASAGQGLPGAAELPYGTGAPYTALDNWELAVDARDFEAYVNCTTDHSSPTCDFTQNTQIPALSDITVTLSDDVPPSISQLAGSLASAAATGATVSGEQTLSFQATDADSGVRTVTITLTPATGQPFTSTVNYGAQCAYDSWNACPLSEDGSATIDTSTLAPGTYAAQITATDAAGNTKTVELGTITTATATATAAQPHLPNGSPCPGVQLGLSLNGKPKLAPIRYGTRVLIHGLLHCGSTPDPGALITIAGDGVSTGASTDTSGAFEFLVPAGPSRTLTFSYLPYSDSSAPAVQASATIRVYPTISLRITPRRTRNHGTILWSGAIRGGPYPAGGLTLLVQVRVGRRWETFDQLLTHDGRFEYAYTFLRTTRPITYKFRVALPASGAAGYDYLSTASHPVGVRVR